ncbi:DUF2946 domain-containing protein, partial [Rhizobium sp. CRIBSB]|nr:DUF2946 domain-containing protein [Rhizobium sp. CRIBSB]
MIRAQADNWSIARSLAFLAATFAIVLGTLLPFAALAAVQPGERIIICSSDGPQTISGDAGADQDGKAMAGGRCASCVMPGVADLPVPPRIETIRLPLPPVADAPVYAVA